MNFLIYSKVDPFHSSICESLRNFLNKKSVSRSSWPDGRQITIIVSKSSLKI